MKNWLDKYLIFCFFSLISIGLVMVASSSMPLTERIGVKALYFTYSQAIYIAIGIIAFALATFIPIKAWHKISGWLLLAGIILLAVLLIPGVTRPINGSLRWFFIGNISFQPSELMKLFLIIYVASYMVRREKQLHSKLIGFFIPMIVLGVVSLLLLLEPDFGSVVIMTGTVLGMLFLGGVHYSRFLTLLPFVILSFFILSVSSSYRLQRLLSYWDPWADQFDTGYQLVQSLIAFGRGSLFGTGLGNSVQKLLYLPESHSDFIFAILAEELGLIGALSVLSLYLVFLFRGMRIGKIANSLGMLFSSYLAYGITLLIGIQVFINIAVNIGLLPTKGITLPFLSSGGSSIVILCLAVGVLCRVDYEAKKKTAKK